jgi:DUF2971 family protein
MPQPLPDELYHYTGINGLKGIIESQTLWATHYKFLSDAEEITNFRNRLPNVLHPVLKTVFGGLTPEQRAILLREHGNIDKALDEEPKNLATAMYNATFFGTRDDPPFAEPYITSFCSVDRGDKRIAYHGLLSQWRGYGPQGGYAIIIDTDELIHLFGEEGGKWAYSLLFGGDVVYSSATDQEMREEFGQHIDLIEENWGKAFRTGYHEGLGSMFQAFAACACRYKHWGFAEEREFRLVAIPTIAQVIEMARLEDKTVLPKKPVSHFLRNGIAVPYLNLFEDGVSTLGRRLPIKRIIVGPHPEKEKRKSAVESLLNQNNVQAQVTVSEIPYLG